MATPPTPREPVNPRSPAAQANRPRAMKQPVMTRRSMRKAAARSLRAASSTGRATPSGVTILRCDRSSASARIALRLAIAAMDPIPPGEDEIETPRHRCRSRNDIAQRRVGDELTAQAFEHAGDQQQPDGTDDDLRRQSAGRRQVGEPAVRAGKGEGTAERQSPGAAQDDGEQLGDAMDEQPTAELDAEAAAGIE